MTVIGSMEVAVGYRLIPSIPPVATSGNIDDEEGWGWGWGREKRQGSHSGRGVAVHGATSRGIWWVRELRRQNASILPTSYTSTMSPSSNPSSSSNRQTLRSSISNCFSNQSGLFLFIIFFCLLACNFLLIFLTITSKQLSAIFELWTFRSLVDGLVGSFFMASWLRIRKGPSILLVRARTFAMATLIFGCCGCIPYVIMLLICGYPLLPASTILQRTSDFDTTPAARKRRENAMFVITTVGLFIFLAGCNLHALMQIDSEPEMQREQKEAGGIQLRIYLHTTTGLFIVAFYILEREGGWMNRYSVVWFLALLVFGNLATCAYVFTLAVQAWERKITIASASLCQRRCLHMTYRWWWKDGKSRGRVRWWMGGWRGVGAIQLWITFSSWRSHSYIWKKVLPLNSWRMGYGRYVELNHSMLQEGGKCPSLLLWCHAIICYDF